MLVLYKLRKYIFHTEKQIAWVGMQIYREFSLVMNKKIIYKSSQNGYTIRVELYNIVIEFEDSKYTSNKNIELRYINKHVLLTMRINKSTKQITKINIQYSLFPPNKTYEGIVWNG